MSMVVYLRAASTAQISELRDHPSSIDAFMYADNAEAVVDFDQAWHALHFVLTGSSDATDNPLSLIIDGSPSIASEQIGCTEFWTVSPEQMRVFATALAEISDDVLMQRYDSVAMNTAGVYLADLFVEEGGEALPYLMQGVPSLRRLAQRCATEGLGVVKTLS